jgi:hypothetical protein
MPRSFCTKLPFRHDRVFLSPDRLLSRTFQIRVPVRPSRLSFQDYPLPRSEQIARWIHDHGEQKAPHSPFVYRGDVVALDTGEGVAVHLWEEPSGRSLVAELPADWFDGLTLYKGLPFKLVTWMVEATPGNLEERHRVEPLAARKAEA